MVSSQRNAPYEGRPLFSWLGSQGRAKAANSHYDAFPAISDGRCLANCNQLKEIMQVAQAQNNVLKQRGSALSFDHADLSIPFDERSSDCLGVIDISVES